MTKFSLGILFGIFICGCVATSWKFRAYGLDADVYSGKLLGPTADKDIDFKNCAPSDQVKGKCYVYLAPEHARLQESFLTLQQQLKECQRR